MSDCLGTVYRKVAEDTGLAEGGVLSRSAKYEVQGRIGADTLTKWDQAGRLAESDIVCSGLAIRVKSG